MLFFFNDTATTEIYTLSLHDALPIWALCLDEPSFSERPLQRLRHEQHRRPVRAPLRLLHEQQPVEQLDRVVLVEEADRKSTRLNSSHSQISYAVFCLKKKNIWHSTPH